MKKIKILTVILPIILFILLAIYVQAGTTTILEESFYFELVEHKTETIVSIMKIISHIGGTISVFCLCLGLFIFNKTRIKYAIPISLTVIWSVVINLFLKNIFARERPDILQLIQETNYSFPSGHSMTNAALYTMAIMLVNHYIKNKKTKYSLCIAFSLIPILIGISRIYLGVHYLGDVVGGFLLGISIAIIIYFIWKKVYIDKKEKSII